MTASGRYLLIHRWRPPSLKVHITACTFIETWIDKRAYAHIHTQNDLDIEYTCRQKYAHKHIFKGAHVDTSPWINVDTHTGVKGFLVLLSR